MNDLVYVIGNGDNPLVKIGHSVDVSKRFAALQAQSPSRLILLGLFKGGRELEQRLHIQLADHRRHGEWFLLTGGEWTSDPVLRVTFEAGLPPCWLPEDFYDEPVDGT